MDQSFYLSNIQPKKTMAAHAAAVRGDQYEFQHFVHEVSIVGRANIGNTASWTHFSVPPDHRKKLKYNSRFITHLPNPGRLRSREI
jgi:hypothetical protein